jgi:hypothetical protein
MTPVHVVPGICTALTRHTTCRGPGSFYPCQVDRESNPSEAKCEGKQG